jgi:hypothetical protein
VRCTKWLALAEKRCGITDHDDAQMFTNNGRELSALAKAIREQTPNAEDRVQSMSGGEVLCTALIAWLRDGDDSLEVMLVLLNWLRRPILRGGTRRAVTQRASASLCTKCTRFDIIAVLYTCTTVASRVATNACATHLRFLTEPQTSFGLASSRSPGVVKT